MWRTMAGVLGAAVLCAGPVTSVAFAGESATGGALGGSAGTSGEHCVANLDTNVVRCSDDADEAARLADAADSLTIAIFYDGINYTGATYTWKQTRECTPSYDPEWQWGDLRQIGWDNRVSSVHTYRRCDVKLYDGYNFSGASSTWIDNSANLGAVGGGWSNRASSVKFS